MKDTAYLMVTCRCHSKKDGGVLWEKSQSDVTEGTAGKPLMEHDYGPVIFRRHSEIHEPPQVLKSLWRKEEEEKERKEKKEKRMRKEKKKEEERYFQDFRF